MGKVAILLATYNGEKYIEEQLLSIQNQSFHDFICYIHDDGSKDNTLALCKKICENDSRFRIMNYPPIGGAKENFLQMMKCVDTDYDYYFFCDQDDYWVPDKIQKMLDRVPKNHNSNGCLVFSDLKVVDEHLSTTSESFYKLTKAKIDKLNYKNVLIKGFIPGCAMMIDKVLLKKANKYSNIENIKMHDWWIVILAFLIEADIIFEDEPLTYYRQHSNNTIGAQNMSSVDRLRFNLKRILNGEIKASKKKNLQSPRQQAMELYNTGFGNQHKREFIKEYYWIGQKNKMRRILFYAKNFHDVYRLWWMLLWV